MIVVFSHYNSFNYNLVHLAGSMDPDIQISRNDVTTVEDIRRLNPDHIILPPGPGYPKDAGICEELIVALSKDYPMLGVCLGHQAICEAYGGKICHATQLMHAKKSTIRIENQEPIFSGLPQQVEGARYHSLVALRESIPEVLRVIGEDSMGEVMAVRHVHYDLYGLQFHPESILTPQGNVIIENFLSIGRERA